MANKWVDNDDYFGPDRRDRRGGRLLNRRQVDESTEPPSLAATLRRLRVLLGNPIEDGSHERAVQLVAAGIAMAERAGNNNCVRLLRRADQSLRDKPQDFDAAEVIVAEAMAQL